MLEADAVGELLTFDRRIWAIIHLPREQRAVVIVRLYRGLSVAETVRVLGKSPGTVKATLNQARLRLRKAEMPLREADRRDAQRAWYGY